MEGVTKGKLTAVVAMMLFLLCVGTCRLTQFNPPEREPIQNDTVLVNRLIEEEMTEANDLQLKVEQLEIKNDSLSKIVQESKKTLLLARQKTIRLEEGLRQTLAVADTSTECPDSLIAITNAYIAMQQENDSLCNQTINDLETAIVFKDSSTNTHVLMEDNLKEAMRLQEYKTQALTEQLKEQIKTTNKKTIQNKWLRGGLLIVSGAAAAYVIQNRK